MDIISVLTYFGITPQAVTPLVIVAIIGLIIVFRHTKPIRNKIISLHTGLTTLNTLLIESEIIKTSCYSEQHSPRVVNSLGEKLLNASGADKLLERIEYRLLEELNNKTLNSLLDLERESLNVLLSKMNDPEFKDIQNFAFQHPNFETFPLSYTDILFIMSLKLRDAYRAKYPNSNLGDSSNEQT